MSTATSIEWTEATWNPTTGCDRISPGCDHCYALTLARRLKAVGQPKYQTDGDPRTSGARLRRRHPPRGAPRAAALAQAQMVFVDSMADIAYAKVPVDFLAQVWAVMAMTPQHTYQILTKRPGRYADTLNGACCCGGGHRPGIHFRSNAQWYTHQFGREVDLMATWPLPNVWLGTSIESDRYTRRADALRAAPAATRFLSLEPLLGPLPSLDLTGIDWAIIGGESGPGARPMRPKWARDLIAQCRAAATAVFVKQLGSRLARDLGAAGKGEDPEYWPEDLRIREYPATATARPA